MKSHEIESQVGAEVSALDEVEVGTSNKVCIKKTGSSCPSGYWQETVGANIQKTFCCRRRTEEGQYKIVKTGAICAGKFYVKGFATKSKNDCEKECNARG